MDSINQALIEACSKADFQQIRAALAQGADPNCSLEIDGSAATPLTALVSVRRSPELLSQTLSGLNALIGAGADVDLIPQGAGANSALGWAARLGEVELLAELLRRGAEPGRHIPTNRSALLLAVQSALEPPAGSPASAAERSFECAKKLLVAGASPFAHNLFMTVAASWTTKGAPGSRLRKRVAALLLAAQGVDKAPAGFACPAQSCSPGQAKQFLDRIGARTTLRPAWRPSINADIHPVRLAELEAMFQ